jgi:5'-phosphate synthase pdxT subunit
MNSIYNKIIIGILSIQGDFLEHQEILKKLGIFSINIRKKEDLEKCDGIIIPGGESTTFSIILEKSGLFPLLKEFCKNKPTWGTCAGLILLSKHILNEKTGGQQKLGLLDITVERNHFGSQLQSFETDLYIDHPNMKDNPIFHAIFIRAPIIIETGKDVKILAKLSDKEIVAVLQNNILGTSFHPELTDDIRWHKFFIEMIISYLQQQNNK